jgi:hypothetical protein
MLNIGAGTHLDTAPGEKVEYIFENCSKYKKGSKISGLQLLFSLILLLGGFLSTILSIFPNIAIESSGPTIWEKILYAFFGNSVLFPILISTILIGMRIYEKLDDEKIKEAVRDLDNIKKLISEWFQKKRILFSNFMLKFQNNEESINPEYIMMKEKLRISYLMLIYITIALYVLGLSTDNNETTYGFEDVLQYFIIFSFRPLKNSSFLI